MPEVFNPSTLKSAKPASSKPEEKPQVKPVVKAKANIRKQSKGEAIASSFFVSTAKDVTEYVVWEVLIPNLKDVLYDMIDGTALMMLWGNDGRSSRRGYSSKKGRNGHETSYTSYYRSSEREGRGYSNSKPWSNSPECSEDRYGVTFEGLDREDAYRLRDSLIDWLDSYHEVPLDIAKAYAGIPEVDIPYLDKQVGWYSLAELKIKKRPQPGRRDSFAVELPPLERLD